MVRKILPMLLVLIAISLTGCGEYGKVEQGRVVAYDTTTTPPTVWIIQDADTIPNQPKYTVLPAHPFTVPADPAEMGQVPAVGLRMQLDVEKKIITMYNPEMKEFDKLLFELVERHNGVSVRKQHPLVYDAATRKERPFPVVNAAENSLTIYSRRQEMLATIKLSPDDFAKYKETDWDAGDEIRVYYKEPGKSLRLMNVTRTDFSKRK